MSEERNNNQQIIRKDAKGCFVEVLNDSFEIGRVHMFFATYDVNKPEGKRQTNSVAIYLPISEVIELCRQASYRFHRKTEITSACRLTIRIYM